MIDNKQDINRIKVVLAEKRTAEWLAEQLKWCTDSSQPSLEKLL